MVISLTKDLLRIRKKKRVCLTDGDAPAISKSPKSYYGQVSSKKFPKGAIRGQLTKPGF